jgi:uncharacterized protein (TIGR00255 family)
MISSMTGYGRGEVTEDHTTATAEIRTVNSRFLEISSRLPRTMSLRENQVKDIVRAKFQRGKINVSLAIIHENESDSPLKINLPAAKAYYKLLNTLRKSLKIQEKISVTHLLQFPEILEPDEFEKGDEKDWALVQKALGIALDEALQMRQREGGELIKDLNARIRKIETMIGDIEKLAPGRIAEARTRLNQRLGELLADPSTVNSERLEMEIALMADKLDYTEECVRFRSHNKFFINAFQESESPGRKLNFLVQEMNREANTLGSKAYDAGVAHIVVAIKEELEKIREQLQNIE